MSIADLKIKIFRQVDSLDSNKLEEFYGIMLNFLNSKEDSDEWIGVTNDEKQGIEDAIKEMDLGKGVSHKKVIAKFRKKYSHV